jgi:hypothetical protein
MDKLDIVYTKEKVLNGNGLKKDSYFGVVNANRFLKKIVNLSKLSNFNNVINKMDLKDDSLLKVDVSDLMVIYYDNLDSISSINLFGSKSMSYDSILLNFNKFLDDNYLALKEEYFKLNHDVLCIKKYCSEFINCFKDKVEKQNFNFLNDLKIFGEIKVDESLYSDLKAELKTEKGVMIAKKLDRLYLDENFKFETNSKVRLKFDSLAESDLNFLSNDVLNKIAINTVCSVYKNLIDSGKLKVNVKPISEIFLDKVVADLRNIK